MLTKVYYRVFEDIWHHIIYLNLSGSLVLYSDKIFTKIGVFLTKQIGVEYGLLIIVEILLLQRHCKEY